MPVLPDQVVYLHMGTSESGTLPIVAQALTDGNGQYTFEATLPTQTKYWFFITYNGNLQYAARTSSFMYYTAGPPHVP